MKALLSTGFKLPKKKNVFLSIGPYKEKLEFLESAQKLVNMGYTLYGTGCAIAVVRVGKHEKRLTFSLYLVVLQTISVSTTFPSRLSIGTKKQSRCHSE